MINKLRRYTPNFLKPVLISLYYSYQKLLRLLRVNYKTRDELHQFWRHPGEGSMNLPIDYLQKGEERSQFLVELINGYVEPNARILEIGCNVGRNLNYLFNAGYTELGGWRLAKML